MAAISTCFFTVRPTKTQSIAFPRKPSCFILKPARIHSGSFSKNLILRHNRRRSSSVHCSIDVEVKAGGIVESDKLPPEVRKRAMDAVDALGKRVTVGDVASKAGLQLSQAQKALQALATDTNGFLEVSDEGDVLYVFPKDYRSNLTTKSFRMKVEPFLEKAKLAGEYLVRVSFGTALIASIVIVYTTIIAILSSRSEEDNRGRRGRSYDSGFTFYLSPTDLFWYWDPYYYRRRRVRKESGGMNFIESVFSFVFGDGDPNQEIEEERWKLVGQYISSNGGVVAAEELAPFLDVETPNKTDDESYILPVLLRFDGQPEVDEEGNILYRFPSLQRTAAPQRSGRKEYVGKRWTDWVGQVERFLQEKKWQFSKTSSSEKALVIGLGGLNLFGVIILGTMLKNMTVSPSSFISFVSEIFPLLQIYAGSFFTIPLIRWFLVRKRNADIERRNQAREQYARALERPDLSLRRKLLSARDMAQRTFIGQDRIIYSTDKDLYEQDYDAQEWEQRFREIEKSE
ncbi:PREDICTED: uncharacterized protein At5g03900, chloroplastic [Nicotiana attenuata]|uniref:Uncharacterized protein, chloroplastic n=1 Tax=Nicotiana attenuata TaxID=49451 RepID=A0A1J6IG45_NICAT|nr:PREDICTED: uncharacterized protein At5g03900, chloroplastic [Nicotiana attenuata]OIT03846.1 uncharacterized protein, chloroplastic [Nicotiana attenuata]